MGRARLAKIVVPLIVWLLVPTSSASRALEITRWDPRGDAFVDVWRSSKNKVVVDGAPGRLRFKVIAQLSNDWSLSVYLDTHGSPRADYRLWHSETFGRGGCNVKRLPDGEPRDVPCDRTFIDDVLLARLWWSVPRPFLAPDKVVRWRVHTHDVGFDPPGRHDDRAPDAGWYP
jgi:hypothetical protein